MVDLLDQLQHHSLDTPLNLAGFLRQVNLHGGVGDIDQTRVDAISVADPEPFQYGCQARLARAQQRSNAVESMHSVP
jgi:hypothetical protein